MWQVNREDLEWCGRAALALLFAALMGVLAVFALGFYMVKVVMEVLFGY